MNTLTFTGMPAAASHIVRRPRRGAASVGAVCAVAFGLACGPLALAPIAAAGCDVGYQDTGKGHGDVTVCEPIPGLATSHYGADSPKQDAELTFLQQLPAYGVSGLDATGQGKAIELAYLMCQLDQSGKAADTIQTVDNPALATGVLNDAKAANMCNVMNYTQPDLPDPGQYGVNPSVIMDIEQKISDTNSEFGGIPIEGTEGRNPVTGGSVNPNQPCAQTDSC